MAARLPALIRSPRLVRVTPPRAVRPVIRRLPAVHRPTLYPDLDLTSEQPGPYEDYGRALTAQGGILIIYKDLDLRLRQYVWRVLAWCIFTGGEGWYVQHHAPIAAAWINLLCVAVAAVVNWLILRTPSECHRRIEIRPDCIIVEETDVFWRRHMEGDPPALMPDKEGNQRLCGIYGTRLVEFLIVRRFDELDRTPEVIAAHLADAFEQLWARPE